MNEFRIVIDFEVLVHGKQQVHNLHFSGFFNYCYTSFFQHIVTIQSEKSCVSPAEKRSSATVCHNSLVTRTCMAMSLRLLCN